MVSCHWSVFDKSLPSADAQDDSGSDFQRVGSPNVIDWSDPRVGVFDVGDAPSESTTDHVVDSGAGGERGALILMLDLPLTAQRAAIGFSGEPGVLQFIAFGFIVNFVSDAAATD